MGLIKKLYLLYGEIRGFEIDADFPLNQAAISGNFSMVRMLVEDLGYDVNQTKSSNIINDCSEYHCSVVRFQIDTPNLPVLIIQPSNDPNAVAEYGLNLDGYIPNK